jgi:hypothetical protein
MSTHQRNKVKAVYLTDAERDLVVMAMSELRRVLSGASESKYWTTVFARSYTARRIEAVVELFKDKKGAKA